MGGERLGQNEFTFERLEVWQDAMKLAKLAYQATKKFPRDEEYGMSSQLRRASVSVPANIAEGRGRFHLKDQIQFFHTARGSLYEMVTLIKLAAEQRYIDQSSQTELEVLCENTLKKLNGLISALKTSPPITYHPNYETIL